MHHDTFNAVKAFEYVELMNLTIFPSLSLISPLIIIFSLNPPFCGIYTLDGLQYNIQLVHVSQCLLLLSMIFAVWPLSHNS